VIELALASGLALVGSRAQNDPLAASSAGTGELVNEALRAGATRVVIAVGGSATTDGGLGALEVIDRGLLGRASLCIACDVRTTFLDAADRFAPQKGATPAQVVELRARLESLAQRYEAELGVDVRDVPGSGAAGGFAGGMLALGAELVEGFALVADSVGLDAQLDQADIVLTGEGCLDATSFQGKVVGEVVRRSLARRLPSAVIAGRVRAAPAGVRAFDLVEAFGEERALADTSLCAERAATAVLAELDR
jgi:glycerate kinase